MKLVLILGNQLFDPQIVAKKIRNKSDVVIFMREDTELCTHFKYHKQKIIFFLGAMRACAEEYRREGFTVHYEKINESADTYVEALAQFIKSQKIEKVGCYEIEDKFFESRIFDLLDKIEIKRQVWPSPMFLTSRLAFSEYLSSHKRPFMRTFYEFQRKRLDILVDRNHAPIGGQWSFDEDNRKPLPRNYEPPEVPVVKHPNFLAEVIKTVEREFPSHPGNSKTFWLPIDREGAKLWLQKFLGERFKDFGPYEDALSPEHTVINHSVLTPFLNTGLLTPAEIIEAAIHCAEKNKISLNSLEGFVRQIIGWREFIRGIYQNFSDVQEEKNFFGHKRKLNNKWYTGETGIPPLDDVIKKVIRHGYAHHIERLMVVGNLMLLCEIEPSEAHRWFMEMFIDSSDWVMGPNVYGMALFSDGGIFATKPYICGSNYYRKMGKYKEGTWQDGVDGLYWSFIAKHESFFLKNARMGMVLKTLQRMPTEKKQRIFKAAEELKSSLT